jgi:hypothetical protein
MEFVTGGIFSTYFIALHQCHNHLYAREEYFDISMLGVTELFKCYLQVLFGSMQ